MPLSSDRSPRPLRPLRTLRRTAPLAAALLLGAPVAPAAAEAPPLGVHDVARLSAVEEVAVSPDGERIAYVVSRPRDPFAEENGSAWTELHLVGQDGVSVPYVAGAAKVAAPAWLPDGSAIGFLDERPGDEDARLYLIPVAGGEARRVVDHPREIKEFSFSPDGARVAFLAKEAEPEERAALEKKGFDQEVVEEEPEPVRVWIAGVAEGSAAPVALELEGSASELHWSPAGDLLAVALAPTPLIDDHYMRRRVAIVDAAGGEVGSWVETEGKLGQAAWSPDGRRLALVAAADYHDPREGRLVVVGAAGGRPTELLPGYRGHVGAIAWLDPETLAFFGEEGVWTALDAVPAAGGERRRLAAVEGPIWRELSASRDGRVLALAGDTPTHPAEVFRLGPGDAAPRRLTDSNPWLAERRLAPQEVVRFKARDGLELEGLLVRPLGGGPEAGPAPLVMMIHGGPEAHYSNGWLTSYSRPSQVLAGRGFASFYPNYRGSTGRGVEFSKLSQGDPAGAEFDDIVDAVDHLIAAGVADRERVGITGGSYGGYASAWAATRQSERFAAAVMFVGISNEISKLGTSDIPNELHAVHLRHWPWDDWKLALERSPVYWVEKARTPILILHGKDDPRVFRGQSMELYRFLKTLGRVPVRLVLYPGEKHGNSKAAARLDYSLRLVRWMEHYLVGPGGDPPPHELVYEEPAAAPAASVATSGAKSRAGAGSG